MRTHFFQKCPPRQHGVKGASLPCRVWGRAPQNTPNSLHPNRMWVVLRSLVVCLGIWGVMCGMAWAELPNYPLHPQPYHTFQQTSNSANPAQQSFLPSHQGDASKEGAWLPLSQYTALHQRANKPLPARNAQVIEAFYYAKVQADGLLVNARLVVASEGEGWHSLAVVLGAYPLISARLGGQTPFLVPAKTPADWTSLLLVGTKRETLLLRFFVPRQAGLDPLVAFRGAPAVASSFEARFAGAGYRPTLEGGIHTRITRSNREVVVSTILPDPTLGVSLRWWQQETRLQAARKDQRKSRMYVRTFALLSIAKAGQEMFLTYRYTLVQAPRERFLLHIPKGLLIRTVRGLGMRDYRLRPDTQQGGQILDVLLVEPVSERYELSILAERRYAQEQDIHLPAPLETQRETGFVGMEAVGNEEITVQATGANPIDVQELPQEIIRGTTRPLLYAFRYTRRPVSWRLHVKRHKSAALPASMIDRAEYLQVANKEGSTWVQAAYRIRNSFKQFMALRLPKGARIRSAFVDGLPVKPAMDAQQRALIPLKRSGQAASRAFPVEVVYSLPLPPFQSYRRYRYTLPQVDLWISALSWRLYLPDGRVTLHKSDLQRDWTHQTAQWEHTTNERNLSDQRSLLQLRRRSSGETTPSPHATGAATSTLPPTDGVGQLPVRVQLPRVGRTYLFHQFHIPAMQQTAMEFSFVGYWLQAISGILFFFAGCCLFLGIALWWMQVSHAQRWAFGLGLQSALMFAFAAWTVSRVAWFVLFLGGLFGVFIAFAIGLLRWFEQKQPKIEQ